jgi:hypothetical protein
VDAAKLAAKAASEKPANFAVLLMAFLLADLFAVIAALLYSGAGRARASVQVWKAMGLGWLARVAAFAVAF